MRLLATNNISQTKNMKDFDQDNCTIINTLSNEDKHIFTKKTFC